MTQRFLHASEAQALATQCDRSDLCAYRALRQRCDRKIKILSSRRPPLYTLTYSVPGCVPECGQFDYKSVVTMLFVGYERDSYRVTWDKENPGTLFIHWNP